MYKQYKGFTLESVVHRAGALKILEAPSRIFKHLHYPDGTKIPIAPADDNK